MDISSSDVFVIEDPLHHSRCFLVHAANKARAKRLDGRTIGTYENKHLAEEALRTMRTIEMLGYPLKIFDK